MEKYAYHGGQTVHFTKVVNSSQIAPPGTGEACRIFDFAPAGPYISTRFAGNIPDRTASPFGVSVP